MSLSPIMTIRARAKQSSKILAWLVGLILCTGCTGGSGDSAAGVQAIWGKQGVKEGDLQKPRAAAIDGQGNLYLVDMTARIQVYDAEGNYQRGWKTPVSTNGRPSGLSFDQEGRLLVADTHYYRVLKYAMDGTLLEDETLGGTQGEAAGEFGFVTDAVEDSQGNLYVGEYGTNDRIQKFSSDGEFLLQWGGHGEALGQFRRPQNLVVQSGTPEGDRIWVVDACNHRVQAFDTEGKLLLSWGKEGSGPGELYYPYDLAFDDEGNLTICEYGNHRVQKFTPEGKSLGSWGTHGRQPGQLHNPWALARDQQGRLFVVDSNNHRVQRIQF